MAEIDPLRDFLTTAKRLGEDGSKTVVSFVQQVTKTASSIADQIIKTAPTPPAPPVPGRTPKKEEKVTLPSVGPLPEVILPAPQEIMRAVEEIPRPKVEGEEGEKKIHIEVEKPLKAAVKGTRLSLQL